MKELKRGTVQTVFLSSNCPAEVEADFTVYGKMGKVAIVKVPQSNEELGVICKKPYVISVLSLKKDEQNKV